MPQFQFGRPSFVEVESDEQRQYNFHILQGNQLFQQKRFREAVQEYTRASEALPNDLSAKMYLAACYESLEDHTKTIEASKVAIALGKQTSCENSLLAKYVFHQFPTVCRFGPTV
jgi:tetratricopeptide (TPR) repeat protein